EPQPRAAGGEALQVQLQKPRPTAYAGDGLKQTVAEMKTPLERGDCPGRAAVDPHQLRNSRSRERLRAPGRHCRSPSAARSPRALARVSSSSRSGSESATMPAPARNVSCCALRVMVRMRM